MKFAILSLMSSHLVFISHAQAQFSLEPFGAQEAYTKWGVPLDKNQIDQALDKYVEQLPYVVEESRRSIELFSNAVEFAQKRFDEIKISVNGDLQKADEIYRAEVDQRKMSYQNQELGSAEFTNIDDSTIVRMIDKMGTVIIFIHAQYVKRDSAHLTKYLSRQHSVAGKTGRNVIIVWHDDNQIISAQKELKAPKWSASYWKGYLNAVYKPATFDSLCFGIISGLAQATLTGILGFIQNGFTPNVAVLAASVFGFGSVIGTYASTYRNVVFYSDSKVSQILKQSVVSFAFAYMLFSLNQLTFGEASHVTSFSEYIGLLLNIFLSSSAKNEFSQWAKIKDLERADMSEYSVKIPFLNKSFSFSERDVNYQMKVQLTTQGIRTADLLGYQFTIPTSNGPITIDLGKILLWLSAPVVHLSVKHWALKNYPETAKELGLDKSFQDSVKEFFKVMLSGFKFNPLKWKTMLTESVIKEKNGEVRNSYIGAMVKQINTNFAGRAGDDPYPLNITYGPPICSELFY
jgi:hypothetical protein